MPTENNIESKFIVKGRLHAPYFIYFKANRELSDQEILKTFELEGYELTGENDSYRKLTVHVATSPTWSLIADDFSYSLCHSEEIRELVKNLSNKYEVFTCFRGDCDYSYAFTRYKDGEIIRDYSFGGWTKERAQVEEDIGEPLPGEMGALEKENEYDVIFQVAMFQGINPKMNLTARTYSKPKPRLEWKGFMHWLFKG